MTIQINYTVNKSLGGQHGEKVPIHYHIIFSSRDHIELKGRYQLFHYTNNRPNHVSVNNKFHYNLFETCSLTINKRYDVISTSFKFITSNSTIVIYKKQKIVEYVWFLQFMKSGL